MADEPKGKRFWEQTKLIGYLGHRAGGAAKIALHTLYNLQPRCFIFSTEGRLEGRFLHHHLLKKGFVPRQKSHTMPSPNASCLHLPSPISAFRRNSPTPRPSLIIPLALLLSSSILIWKLQKKIKWHRQNGLGR